VNRAYRDGPKSHRHNSLAVPGGYCSPDQHHVHHYIVHRSSACARRMTEPLQCRQQSLSHNERIDHQGSCPGRPRIQYLPYIDHVVREFGVPNEVVGAHVVPHALNFCVCSSVQPRGLLVIKEPGDGSLRDSPVLKNVS
jgi:hypothetical protein